MDVYFTFGLKEGKEIAHFTQLCLHVHLQRDGLQCLSSFSMNFQSHKRSSSIALKEPPTT